MMAQALFHHKANPEHFSWIQMRLIKHNANKSLRRGQIHSTTSRNPIWKQEDPQEGIQLVGFNLAVEKERKGKLD
jgi:hypothetical protein